MEQRSGVRKINKRGCQKEARKFNHVSTQTVLEHNTLDMQIVPRCINFGTQTDDDFANIIYVTIH
jgi:hypothetical protein